MRERGIQDARGNLVGALVDWAVGKFSVGERVNGQREKKRG